LLYSALLAPVVIGGHHVESELALEFSDSLFLGTAASGEVPEGAWAESEIGRHRGVFEITVVGGEQVGLVILGALMMHPFAVGHHTQLKSLSRQREPGFAAVDIGSNRAAARPGGDQGFDLGPLTAGDFDRVTAALANEQLEEISIPV
jgi:hypothetical protein